MQCWFSTRSVEVVESGSRPTRRRGYWMLKVVQQRSPNVEIFFLRVDGWNSFFREEGCECDLNSTTISSRQTNVWSWFRDYEWTSCKNCRNGSGRLYKSNQCWSLAKFGCLALGRVTRVGQQESYKVNIFCKQWLPIARSIDRCIIVVLYAVLYRSRLTIQSNRFIFLEVS